MFDEKHDDKKNCELGHLVDHYFFCALDNVDDRHLSVLSKNVDNDLELPIMYDELFSSKDNLFFEHIKDKWLARITTDVDYLEDTQEVIRGMIHFSEIESVCSLDIQYIWQDTINNSSFFENNKYVGIKKLHFMNKCIPYLQTQSTCTILAPVFNLFYIVSNMFIFLFASKLSYASIMSTAAETPFSKLLYYAGTILLFLYHVYQNIHGSLGFRHIIEKANAQLVTLKKFHDNIIKKMTLFSEQFGNLGRYRTYCKRIDAYRDRLINFSDTCLHHIAPLKWNMESYKKFGYILYAYYEVANSQLYQECFAVAIGFDAYVKSMISLYQGISQSRIAFTTFVQKEKKKINTDDVVKVKVKEVEVEVEEEVEVDVEVEVEVEMDKNTHISFIELSYPVHFNLLDNVTNDVRITNDNMIITGVNASGKTTVIKSLTINIIFSQQIGCGYYSSGQLLPYRHIYSYLNIPDTANRDSLFQAESRRCKTILDSIDANVDDRHFCIFDELYSGTNPDEATKAASSYISYLSKNKNVTFLLTTHYYDICHHVEKEKDKIIKNYHMAVTYSDTDAETYINTFKLVEGISLDKNGAYRVLAEMQYPKELLQNIIQFK